MQLLRRIKNYFALNFTLKKVVRGLSVVLIVLFIFFLAVPLNLLRVINRYYSTLIYTDIEKVPVTRVAIVFGAGLSPDGTKPSGILEDRIMSAVELYKAGKIQKILMSGDNRFEDYNEPQVMIKFARDNGVSSFDLQADFAGRRTYDTCYRAKYIFGVENAVLITQDFHLPRALYTCSTLGIESVGYAADKSDYISEDVFALRDLAATLLAYWELNVSPPSVVLGDKINF